MYWLSIVLIATGILSCFWGYRVCRIVLGILGFFAGAYFAAHAVFKWTGNVVFAVIAAVAGGLLGGWLIVAAYLLGVFMLGAAGALVLLFVVSSAGNYEPGTVLLVVAAIIGGILAVTLQKLILILSTSFLGAWLFLAGLLSAVGGGISPVRFLHDPDFIIARGCGSYSVMMLLWLLLGIGGFVFQYRFSGRRRPVVEDEG